MRQQTFYVIFSLLGAYADVEVRTPTNRVDLAMAYMNRLYLFEMKRNSTPAKALEQIEKKNYAQRFATLDLPVVKIGVNLDSTTRNITWLINE